MNVRKHDADISTLLENADRFIGATRRIDAEARLLDDVDGVRPDEEIVLDYEHVRLSDVMKVSHDALTSLKGNGSNVAPIWLKFPYRGSTAACIRPSQLSRPCRALRPDGSWETLGSPARSP